MKLDYSVRFPEELLRPATPAKITSVDLRFNLLRSLPEWLQECRNVEVLLLGGNELSALPQWVGGFRRLRILNLSHNPLQCIPEVLSRLPRLEALRLNGTGLTSIAPDFHPAHLKFLDLSNNHLRWMPRTFFDHCREIRVLLLRENRLLCLPPSIANLKWLRRLDLSHNSLGLFRAHACRFPELRVLGLQANRLLCLSPEFGSLVSLRELTIHDNRLKQLPESIGQLAALRYLDANNNALSGLPLDIGSCRALHHLIVSRNPFQWLSVSLRNLPRFTTCFFP